MSSRASLQGRVMTGVWVDELHDSFHDRAYWRKKFLWWPRRSALTGRWLYLRPVYEGTAMWTGPGDPVFEFRYHETREHLIWKLKQ